MGIFLFYGMFSILVGECFWGISFGAKRYPPDPPKSPRGREFRLSLPLDPLSQRPKEGIALPLDSLPGRGGDTSVLLLILGFETADLPGLSCVPVQVMVMWVFDAGSVMLSTCGSSCLLARWFWEHFSDFVGLSPPLRVLL